MSENKENVPKIRFPGFSDDWEQRRLGDVLTEKRRPIKMEDDEEYQLVTVKRRNEGIVSRGYFKGKDILVKNYFEIRTGDYLISKRQVIHGANGIVPKSLDKSIVSNEYLVSVGNKNITAEYLTLISKQPNMYRQFFLSSYGVDIEKLVFDVEDWKKRTIMIPSLPEQEKITLFFQRLDNLLTLHQRKLNNVKKLKAGLLQKMFPKDGEGFPEVRFPGFADAWKQRKFSETFIYLQNNSLSRADLNYEQGLVKNVHYGDVLIKFGEILNVEKAEIPFISNTEFNISSTSLLQNGDVVIADAAEDETVGKCSEIKGIDGISIVSGLHTIPCRPNKTFAIGYLGYYMNSSAYHDQLLPLIQGTKISSISKSALQNTDIIYPDSEQEQLQIGRFFQNLDHLITLHQRKLKHLQEQKKALLQQMFV